jgi:endonuclease/exonuclease/phosphatase family metal-dependent hydrolase
MATKKTFFKILGVVIVIAGAALYVWRTYGDVISQITGINVPEAPSAIPFIGEPVSDETGSPPAAPAPSTTPPPKGEGSLPAFAEADKIRVYSFNIQIFGKSKMNKPKVVDVLVDIVSRGDVIAIQEVRSDTDEPVTQFMGLLPDKFDYVLGPREGRTASKEQFWVIYDTEKIEMLDSATFDDADDRFQRSPMAVHFKTKNGFDFILIDNHIQPSDAEAEISFLPEVITYFQTMWNEKNVMVMGDFNADGGYYNETKLDSVFPPSDYYSVIGNEWDTTVATGDNTYDRFIITAPAKAYFTGECGVVYYDTIYDFDALGIEPKNVSDHYPVWAEFYLDGDSD